MHDHQNNVVTDFIRFNETHPLVQHLQAPYYQLGLICSVQALPELLDLEEWLLYLWKEQVISFDNEQQAAEYAQNVLRLVNAVQGAYQEALPLVDLNCSQWLDQEQELTTDCIQFSAGFLAGVELFNANWFAVEGDENTQNILQTTILLLTKLAPPEDADEQIESLFEQLPEEKEILQILPQLLSNLAFSSSQAFLYNQEDLSEQKI